MLPDFTAAGFLPPGVHPCSWDEFVARYSHGWRRPTLIEGLQQMLNLLAFANCTEVRLGGSFVSSKPVPGDFDGIYMLEGVDRNKLPLELDASVNAQGDIFGGCIVPANWEFTDIGAMATCLERTKKGDQVVGLASLNPRQVPIMEAWPRYAHRFPGGEGSVNVTQHFVLGAALSA